MVVIVVTGTPGTGKTTVARKIAETLGYFYVDVHRLIDDLKLCDEYDEQRVCKVVDVEKLIPVLEKVIFEHDDVVIDSHMAHYLSSANVDLCIVTRCDLGTLHERLKKRTYSLQKVRDNMDVEIFDHILNEAEEQKHNILIVDTTKSFDIESIKEKLRINKLRINKH